MRQVIILSGVSGSGKSTYAKTLMHDAKNKGDAITAIVSTDDYFTDVNGVYNFDARKLSEAHSQCFRHFILSLQANCNLVIVDNTNTTQVEIAPYMLGASAFGYKAEIHTLNINISTAHARNVHNVRINTISSQHIRIANRVMLPWWKHVEVPPPTS